MDASNLPAVSFRTARFMQSVSRYEGHRFCGGIVQTRYDET
jgi:hypothetical protein